MVYFPSIVVFIGCLALIDVCRGKVTLQKAKDIRFNTMKETTIEANKGQVFCFKNRVDCVEYDYNTDDEVLAFIVSKDSVANTLDTPGVSSLDFIPKSNRTGMGSFKRVDVKVETGNYCVVFVNGPFESPFYAGPKNSSDVTVQFEIQGCPTKYQKLVAILLPIGAVLLIAACFSAWWIRRRRTSLKKQKTQNQNQENQGQYPVNEAYPHGQHPYPSPPDGTYAIPSNYTPGSYPASGDYTVPMPGQPGHMTVPMGAIPYSTVAVGGQGHPVPPDATTGVPMSDSQAGRQGEHVRDPSAINAVWAAAAENVDGDGTDGRGGAGQGEDGGLGATDSRDMNTAPYMSGLVPSRDSENVADSDTRV